MAQTNLILTKESTSNEIKSYFSTILELSKSDNEFPINLDEVWMLVYTEKGKAVRALKENFIEGVDFKVSPKYREQVFAQNGKNLEEVDYQVLRKNPQNPNGGRPTVDYYLTVPCLEFFIARRIRPVFEVYRQVFHGAAKMVQRELTRKELIKLALEAEEEKERLQLVNIEQEHQLKLQAPKVEYHDKVLSSEGYLTVNMIADCLGISAIKLNKLLCEWDVQYYESKTYHLKAKYRDKGYVVHRPHPYVDSQGNIKTRQQMYWTELGKQFILDLYNKKMAA